MENRVCKACLIDDAADADVVRVVAEYIASLPPERRADAETVRARLRHCEACASRADQMCSLCGCFVCARAAKNNSRCATVPPKW